MTSYDQPLDAARLAEQQATERARLCDRLETMWRGLQQDIETQRDTSERGVDPRSQQLQLQIIKVQAQLWRMLGAPLPEPEPEPDPEKLLLDAQQTAADALDRVAKKIAAGS